MRQLILGIFLVTLCAISPAHAQEWVDVFDPQTLLTLNLELDDQDWDTIRHDLTNEIEVQALFWADGEEASKLLVSLRRKSSRALPSEQDPQKVSYKVDINEFVSQRWRGLTKLSLENGADTDPISEGLAWNLHEMATGTGFYPAGHHAGLAAWVRLVINGQYVGVYVNVEERDSQFLRNRSLPRGTTAEGVTRSWLYEIDDLGAGSFELEDGDLPHGPTWNTLCYSPFIASAKKGAAACATPNDATLLAQLDQLIDMQIMLTQGAVDAFSSNNDALFTHGKNFRHIDFNTTLFPDLERLYLVWDLDAAITDVAANIYAKSARRGFSQTPYQSVILNHPTFRVRYNAIMNGLLDSVAGPLSEAAIHQFLNGVEPVVTAALVEDPHAGFADAGAVASHFDALRGWITQRIANIASQVQANQPPPRP